MTGLACILAVLLAPHGGGTVSPLLIPVHYQRIELAQNEPLLLELALAPGEWQVVPASLGYFTSDPSSGLRRFVFSAEVPRGLLYRWLPDAADSGSGLGRVEVIEINAPANSPLYFEEQLAQIRSRVVELNRERNLLLQARQQLSASRSSYSATLDALWPALQSGPGGLDDGGWSERVLARYPGEIAQINAQLARDAQARGQLKQLYYSGQQARLKLLLSQFDLQHGLARLPRPRSEELLSMGNTRLVQATVLEEIDRLQQVWEQRQAELLRETEVLRAQPVRWMWQPAATHTLHPGGMDMPDSGSMLPGQVAEALPQQQLAAAIQSAWLDVQQQELEALRGALPALAAARAYVSGRSAPDWSTLPRRTVSAPQLHELTLEGLRHYGELDAGLSQADAVDLLAGLARQFETQADPANPPASAVDGGHSDRLRQTLDGLAGGWINASPDELAYGLLAVERSRAALPETPEQGPLPLPEDLPGAALAGDTRLALRAGLAGQLDLILRAPDSRGLAAYDLAYLRFIRWYCALGLPPEAPPVAAAGEELLTESYGFSTADQAPVSTD